VTLSEEEDAKARERQRVILEVLSGRMTATEAAGTLRVSRKTYYEWQDRGLSAMHQALMDRPGGRPPKPVDPEKERLQQALAVQEKDRQVLEGRLRIQEAIRQTLEAMGPDGLSKKKGDG